MNPKGDAAMRFVLASITIITVFAATAHAKDNPVSQLHAVRSLKCHFGSGTAAKWTSSTPKTIAAYSNEDILIDSIDLKENSAQMSSNTASVTSRIMINKFEISFIASDAGVLVVTNVFPIYSDTHDFIAIYTRHVLASGTITSEQYFGTCKTWH